MSERQANQLRPVSIQRGFPSHAAGSVMIACGETRVLCTASIAADVPSFLIDKETGLPRGGWVTAEYNMLPGSTVGRKKRGPDSRGTEIKRLIGRALRAALDLDAMPGLAITCDCDVIKADGGTRTASITGACVALADAIGVGIVDGEPVLDLDYEWDSRADVDMNVVMNGEGEYIEIQGTGEAATFDRQQLDAMLDLAGQGIQQLLREQATALKPGTPGSEC